MDLPQETTSWVMLLVGMALLAAILLRNFYRYRGKLKREDRQLQQAAAARRSKRTAPNVEQPLMDAPPDILRWQVEMHETARVLQAELDSKMSALQALSKIAREEAQRLEAIIERAERIGAPIARDTLDEIERVADVSSSESMRVLDELPEAPAAREGDLPGDEQRRRRALELAERGQSPATIADVIGATLGEVEMILSLREPPNPA